MQGLSTKRFRPVPRCVIFAEECSTHDRRVGNPALYLATRCPQSLRPSKPKFIPTPHLATQSVAFARSDFLKSVQLTPPSPAERPHVTICPALSAEPPATFTFVSFPCIAIIFVSTPVYRIFRTSYFLSSLNVKVLRYCLSTCLPLILISSPHHISARFSSPLFDPRMKSPHEAAGRSAGGAKACSGMHTSRISHYCFPRPSLKFSMRSI
ncbi:hypothetical protein BC629DRAFT_1070658 [Irpex lacteus]|nr:hypothetical protein BC629DRAFT_1070658 [Irpex lacteus]